MIRRKLREQRPWKQLAVFSILGLIGRDAALQRVQSLPSKRLAAFVIRNQHANAAVADNVAHAVGRRLRIERDINSARLEHAQHADDRFHALRKKQSDAIAFIDSLFAQQVSHLVRSLFQFAISDALAAGPHRRLSPDKPSRSCSTVAAVRMP